MDDSEAASLLALISNDWLRRVEAAGDPPPGDNVRAALAALAAASPDTAAKCERLMKYVRTGPAAGVSLAFLADGGREPETWITPAQAARITGLTPNGVRDAARTGRIRAAKRGGRWAVDEQSARAYGRDGDMAGRGPDGHGDVGPAQREVPVHAKGSR